MVALICISNHPTRKRFLLQVSTWNKCSYCIVNTRGWRLAWFLVIQRAKKTRQSGEIHPRDVPGAALQMTFPILRVLQSYCPKSATIVAKISVITIKGARSCLAFSIHLFPVASEVSGWSRTPGLKPSGGSLWVSDSALPACQPESGWKFAFSFHFSPRLLKFVSNCVGFCSCVSGAREAAPGSRWQRCYRLCCYKILIFRPLLSETPQQTVT